MKALPVNFLVVGGFLQADSLHRFSSKKLRVKSRGTPSNFGYFWVVLWRLPFVTYCYCFYLFILLLSIVYVYKPVYQCTDLVYKSVY